MKGELPPLTPLQQRVRDDLLQPGGPRPTFPPELGRRLLDGIRAGTEGATDLLAATGEHLYVNKHALDRVHACERHHRAESRAGFPGWTPARARGSVAHRAIELAIFSEPSRPPLALVDDVIAAYEAGDDDWTPGRWLRDEASPAERAELRSGATTVATMFEECFPPLPARWQPRVEVPFTVPVQREVLTLAARPDLVLGKPIGTTARVLVIDFKTGKPAPAHLDDARFYALLVALKTGVPPYRSVAFYLDSGTWTAVDITEDDLDVAARRVIDGVTKLAAITAGGREPLATPGPTCSYCCIRDDCDVAFGHRSHAGDDDQGGETPF